MLLSRHTCPAVPAGFYAQSMGEHSAGIQHFRAVLNCESCSHLHVMAAASAALCELQRDGSADGVGRAVELMESVAQPEGCAPAPQDK